MTALGSLAFLAALLAPSQEEADNILKAAHQQAQASARALIDEDWDKLVELTYPKVVAQMGGKAKMIAAMQKVHEEWKGKQITMQSAAARAPTRTYRAGSEQMTVVPITIEMDTPAATAKVKSFLVGISADRGRKWSFIDGSIGEAKIRTLVPNLPREMKLPEAQKPVLEKKPVK